MAPLATSDQGGGSGVHITVGSGSSKSDYHFSTLLALATIGIILFMGFALGALLFGFEILNRV